MRKQPVVVIVGATGSGKSDLGIRCAREFHGEIICADSRTVYRGMDIGTAKPTASEINTASLPTRSSRVAAGDEGPPPPLDGILHPDQGVGVQDDTGVVWGITHHLLDIRDPDQPYSVAEFKEDAERCIRDIAGWGRMPIVVGGTMLYVRALVDNLNLAGAQPNPQRRAELERMSLAELQKILTSLDPDAVEIVDAENPRRCIRAIETIEATGLSLAAARVKRETPFDYSIIGLDVPREELHRRIAARTHAMFGRGLIAETQRLLTQYGPDIEPLRGVVYREAVALLLQGAVQRDDTVLDGRPKLCHPNVQAGWGDGGGTTGAEARINAALRRYARRQLAWWRKDPRVRWVRTYEEARACIAMS